MPSPVKVVFDADTGRFVSSVDGATKAVTKQAEAVAAAKNKILESFNQQIEAAKKNGASTEELTRLQQKSAESLANVTEKNANRVVAALDRISDKQKRVAEELKNLGEMPEPSHGSSVTNQQRASALLRGGGLRAGEQFASQFEMFNKIATIAFPIAGASMLAKEAWHAVEALKEMYETGQKMPAAIERGFNQLSLSMGTANDQLDLTNAKLENAHAKFAKKPENALKVAFIEARLEADRFAIAVANDTKAVNDLLAAHHLSGFYSLMGKGGTATTEGSINSYMTDLQDLSFKRSEAVGRNDTKAADDFTRQYQAKIASGLEKAQRQLHLIDHPEFRGNDDDINPNEDNSASKQEWVGFRGVLQDMQHRDASVATNQSDQAQAAEDEKKRAAAEAAKAAKEKADAAARKAMEAKFQAFRGQEDILKPYLSADQVAEDWAAFRDSFVKGSAGWLKANEEWAAKRGEAETKDAEAVKQAAEKAQQDQRRAWDLDHDAWASATHRTADDEADFWAMRLLQADKGSENERVAYDKYTRALIESQKAADEAAKARNKASLAQGEQKGALAEATLAIEQQTGQISRHDAAIQQANIHAEQFRLKMQELQAELARETKLDPTSAGTVNAQAAVDKETAANRIQVMQDAAAEAATTWQGALENADNQWVQHARDGAEQVSQLFTQTMSGLNSNLTDAIVGDKTHFGEMFKGVGKSVVNSGLGLAESSIMGKFGLAKADGSKGNPLHVMVENMGAGMSNAASGLSSMFSGAASSVESGGSKALGFLGNLGSSALSFIPGMSGLSSLFGGHKALGGGVNAGMAYDVGEMGRETFVPDTNGSIVPNNKLGGLGSTAHYAIYMDGGITSEQVDQQINSALRAVHPKVVRDATHAVSEKMARRPRSAS